MVYSVSFSTCLDYATILICGEWNNISFFVSGDFSYLSTALLVSFIP